MDTEAIAWAAQKLQAFAVDNSTMDNALMMDRLYAMLSVAPTPPEIEPVDDFPEYWEYLGKNLQDNLTYDKWKIRKLTKLKTPPSPPDDRPIPMILHCPGCGVQHIDRPEGADWLNPPHKSHLCHDCGHIWRPADVATSGVESIQTKGRADSPLAVKAADDELRKAAEEALLVFDEWIRFYNLDEEERSAIENLRAALNKGKL